MDPSQPWRWYTMFPLAFVMALAFLFQWGVASHDVDMPRYLFSPSSRTDGERGKVRATLRKVGRQGLED